MTIKPKTIRAKLIVVFVAAFGPVLCFEGYCAFNDYLIVQNANKNERIRTASAVTRDIVVTLSKLRSQQNILAERISSFPLKQTEIESVCKDFDSLVGVNVKSEFLELQKSEMPLLPKEIGETCIFWKNEKPGDNYLFSVQTPIRFADGNTGVLISHFGQSIFWGDASDYLKTTSGYSFQVISREKNSAAKANENHFVLKRYIPDTNLKVILIGPYPDMYDYIRGKKNWLMELISAILTGSLIIFIMGNRLTHPLKKLELAANALAVGDYGKKANIKTGDELEAFAKVFNSIGDSLEKHEDKLSEQTDMLSAMVQAAHVASSSLNMRECAKAIAKVVCTHFSATDAIVFWRDNVSGGEKVLGKFGENSKASWKRIASHAASSGEYLVISEQTTQRSYSKETCIESYLVGVPLTDGLCCKGALVARFENEISRDDLKFGSLISDVLIAFGIHAAAAIQNAEAYSRTEKYSNVLEDWVEHLSSVKRVTDAISHMPSLDETLFALAKAIAVVLKADKCAIYLPNREGQLVVRSSYGTEDIPLQNIKIECGECETGRAFEQKMYIACGDIQRSESEKTKSKAKKNNVKSLISTPLTVEDNPIGAITMYYKEPRQFTSKEIRLLTSIGLHAALIVRNASLYTRESSIAEALQNGLVKQPPESCFGLSFASKYIPALDEARVGGDFYDITQLPDGKIGVVIGDVSGKGLKAAIHLAACKYMMKTLMYADPHNPASVLSKLNEAIYFYYRMEFFVTMFYVVIDPENNEIIYSNAGHPPAIIISKNNKMHSSLISEGTPVGAGFECKYQNHSIKVEDTDILLLYTDGITDLMKDGVPLGIEGFNSMLFDVDCEDVSKVIDHIISRIKDNSELSQKDDIALLAVSSGKMHKKPINQGDSDEYQYCLPTLFS